VYTDSIILCMNDVTQVSESEYFDSLIKSRDKYIKLFEKYNRAYKLSNLKLDKDKMETYCTKQDKVQEKIDVFTKEKGYMDPADFPHSEGESE